LSLEVEGGGVVGVVEWGEEEDGLVWEVRFGEVGRSRSARLRWGVKRDGMRVERREGKRETRPRRGR
jgi:hypothetical protein